MTASQALNPQWKEHEWEAMKAELEKLSVTELRTLAERLGIQFERGFDSLKDRDWLTVKDQIILVLDEPDRNEFNKEYQKFLADKAKNL